MGHVINPSAGSLTFNNSPSTVSDLQALSDRAEAIADAAVATVADLENIEHPRLGELRRVSSDGGIWAYDGGGWGIAIAPKTLVQYGATAAVPWGATGKVTALSAALATDTGAFTHTSGTFTCQRAIRARVDVKLTLAATAGAASLYLRVNGINVAEAGGFGSTSGGHTLVISETVELASGDTVEVWSVGNPANVGFANGAAPSINNRITITDA